MTTYRISLSTDAVVISPDDSRDIETVLQSSAPVVGGVISLGVAHPAAGIRSLITDPDAAGWWLPLLYGDAVADVVAAYDGGDDDERVVEVADVPLAHSASRLLLGLWLQRWIPAAVVGAQPFAEWVLQVELGALALECDPLFLSDQPAASLLAPHLQKLTASVDYHRTHQGGGGVNEVVGNMTVEAAAAALACVDVDAPNLDELDVALERFRALERETSAGALTLSDEQVAAIVSEWSGSVGEAALTRDSDVAATRPPALTAPHGRIVADATAPVDWGQVHPRSASAASDAVHWALWRDGDGVGIEIRVDARGASPERLDSARLFARVELGDDTEGVALENRGEAWVASAKVSAPEDDSLVRVTIYEAGVGTPSRTGPTLDQIESTRRAVSAVVRHRFDTAAREDGAVGELFAAELLHRPALG